MLVTAGEPERSPTLQSAVRNPQSAIAGPPAPKLALFRRTGPERWFMPTVRLVGDAIPGLPVCFAFRQWHDRPPNADSLDRSGFEFVSDFAIRVSDPFGCDQDRICLPHVIPYSVVSISYRPIDSLSSEILASEGFSPAKPTTPCGICSPRRTEEHEGLELSTDNSL